MNSEEVCKLLQDFSKVSRRRDIKIPNSKGCKLYWELYYKLRFAMEDKQPEIREEILKRGLKRIADYSYRLNRGKRHTISSSGLQDVKNIARFTLIEIEVKDK
jgi:hypothetical protein